MNGHGHHNVAENGPLMLVIRSCTSYRYASYMVVYWHHMAGYGPYMAEYVCHKAGHMPHMCGYVQHLTMYWQCMTYMGSI